MQKQHPTHMTRVAAGLAAGYERKNEGGADVDLGEVKTLLETQGRAWEEFKKTNDERLAKLAKGEAVSELEAKLAKLNDELSSVAATAKEIAVKANRPQMGAGGSETHERELKAFNAVLGAHAAEKSRQFSPLAGDAYAQYKAAVGEFIRRGDRDMSDAQRKAINVGTDPQGGYLATFEMESTIDRVVGQYSPMRQLARVIPIGSASYKKLVKVRGAAGATRGGETTAPVEGTSPGWAELEFKPGTYLSDQRITSEALEDAVQDVESDLMTEMGMEFAEMEGEDFITGSGVNGPRGILSYDMVANASYAWGKVGYVKTGGAASFAATNPSDALIDLQHSLKRAYRANAVWQMNDATLASIRKFKDGNGIYLWAPSSLQGGIVGQLLGHEVVTDDFMPDLGANKFPVLFGDHKRAYYIIDRRGMVILRDPFTAVPYVKFVGRRRVGGGVANFEAIKALKCEA